MDVLVTFEKSNKSLKQTREVARHIPLEQKIALLTGTDMWHVAGLPEVGLRSLVLSDGPAGVRGISEDPEETSVLFPCPSALASCWDEELAFITGQAFAEEALVHGVDVILAPQINLQRTPVGGRHFECYSEDPLLTGRVGGAFIEGIQSQGIGACAKHFVANDSETMRTAYIATVSEKTLREVYLAPFEYLVKRGVWTVMAAYNAVDDGTFSSQATDHKHLLRGILKDEWGFDGVVMSDWLATKSTVGSALGGLDLVMPGPDGPWGQRLLDAVRSGQVPESEIDDKVARLLLLAARVGKYGVSAPKHSITPSGSEHPIPKDISLRICEQATVVLECSKDSPWIQFRDRSPASIAMIGPNATDPYVMGGGSSNVRPSSVVGYLEGMRSRFPNATLRSAQGCNSRRFLPTITPRQVTVEFLDAQGVILETQTHTDWKGRIDEVPARCEAAKLTATVFASEVGENKMAVGTVGIHEVRIDGVLASTSAERVGANCVLDSSVNQPPSTPVSVLIERPREVEIVSTHQVIHADGYGDFVRAVYRHSGPQASIEEQLEEATTLASQSELVVVVIGTNEETESEGWDRPNLGLPGSQNALVERILAVRPDATIVVNAGAPVILPWLDRAQTVLWNWLPGQFAGTGLAAVIAGDTEASGRLPWTLPACEEDVPVPSAIPGEGLVLAYDEGTDIGYRGWALRDQAPARPFGYGLGWSTWTYNGATLHHNPDSINEFVQVTVSLTNTGNQTSLGSVQVYLAAPQAKDRPVLWLAGFARAWTSAGATEQVLVSLPKRQFEVWNAGSDEGRWELPSGTYVVSIGANSEDLPIQLEFNL